MTPETKLKNATLTLLNNVDGLWYYKVSDRFTSGIPDIIGCYKGKFIALELKAPNKKQTILQKVIMNMIKNSGGITKCADNITTVKKFIRRIKNV